MPRWMYDEYWRYIIKKADKYDLSLFDIIKWLKTGPKNIFSAHFLVDVETVLPKLKRYIDFNFYKKE